MIDMKFYMVKSAPHEGFSGEAFLRHIGMRCLILTYDLDGCKTIIGIERKAGTDSDAIARWIPGLEMITCDNPYKADARLRPIAYHPDYDKEREIHQFSDIFDSGNRGTLSLAFVPARKSEISRSKGFIERRLSEIEVRETSSSQSGPAYRGIGRSVQRELFMESDERVLLRRMLDSISSAILSGGLAYKTFVLIPSRDQQMYSYAANRVLFLREFGESSGTEIPDLLYRTNTFASSPADAGHMLRLYGRHRSANAIPTPSQSINGDIIIGSFMKDGVTDTKESVGIEKTCLNLGFMLSGLPGSGKTSEAMAVISGIMGRDAGGASAEMTKPIIITPTGEWRGFAISHGMELLSIYDDNIPINFFRCPGIVDRRKFYENLAMILSSASNAGPYQNPMEKCMLNAFRRVYESTSEPDPVDAYMEIESAVIRFHAKRSGASVKYTKHGENIRSALENLRAIIGRPEYCATEGIKIEDISERGAVFDISGASNAAKPYIYALVLNLVYALCSSLDIYGDRSLRLLICLEESQLIFGDRYSAAVKDLRQRIQDFRKQGIGLILLAHNANEIDPQIRRLCQLKLYLKQAPDVSLDAAKDLVFRYANEDAIAMKLKSLDSRIGAFSGVSWDGGARTTQDAIFMRTIEYKPEHPDTSRQAPGIAKGLSPVQKIACALHILPASDTAKKMLECLASFRITYLGEPVAEGEPTECTIHATLFEGKAHILEMIDRRGRTISEHRFRASGSVVIPLGQ